MPTRTSLIFVLLFHRSTTTVGQNVGIMNQNSQYNTRFPLAPEVYENKVIQSYMPGNTVRDGSYFCRNLECANWLATTSTNRLMKNGDGSIMCRKCEVARLYSSKDMLTLALSAFENFPVDHSMLKNGEKTIAENNWIIYQKLDEKASGYSKTIVDVSACEQKPGGNYDDYTTVKIVAVFRWNIGQAKKKKFFDRAKKSLKNFSRFRANEKFELYRAFLPKNIEVVLNTGNKVQSSMMYAAQPNDSLLFQHTLDVRVGQEIDLSNISMSYICRGKRCTAGIYSGQIGIYCDPISYHNLYEIVHENKKIEDLAIQEQASPHIHKHMHRKLHANYDALQNIDNKLRGQ